jgi:hypothetical protein
MRNGRVEGEGVGHKKIGVNKERSLHGCERDMKWCCVLKIIVDTNISNTSQDDP